MKQGGPSPIKRLIIGAHTLNERTYQLSDKESLTLGAIIIWQSAGAIHAARPEPKARSRNLATPACANSQMIHKKPKGAGQR